MRERLGLSPEWLTQLSSCLSCGKMRLGMCEACRHILEDPFSMYVKWAQCTSLTYSGLQMAERLVILSQVQGATHGNAAQLADMVRVSTGQRELLEPFIGHRPDPSRWQ